MIEHRGTRYVVDPKLGHFRQLSSPFEVIEFDSERGKGMPWRIPTVTSLGQSVGSGILGALLDGASSKWVLVNLRMGSWSSNPGAPQRV